MRGSAVVLLLTIAHSAGQKLEPPRREGPEVGGPVQSPQPHRHAALFPHSLFKPWVMRERLADPLQASIPPSWLCSHQCPPETITCRGAHLPLAKTSGSLPFQSCSFQATCPCPRGMVYADLLPLLLPHRVDDKLPA